MARQLLQEITSGDQLLWILFMVELNQKVEIQALSHLTQIAKSILLETIKEQVQRKEKQISQQLMELL